MKQAAWWWKLKGQQQYEKLEKNSRCRHSSREMRDCWLDELESSSTFFFWLPCLGLNFLKPTFVHAYLMHQQLSMLSTMKLKQTRLRDWEGRARAEKYATSNSSALVHFRSNLKEAEKQCSVLVSICSSYSYIYYYPRILLRESI